MQSQARQKALERMGPLLSKVGAEAIAANVLHALLVGKGWDGTCWIVFAESIREENKIGETAPDGGDGLLEG